MVLALTGDGVSQESGARTAGATGFGMEMGTSFALTRSEHFVVACDDPSYGVHGRLTWLERTFERVLRFCRFNGLDVQTPAGRLELVFTRDWPEYRSLKVGVVAPGSIRSGYYHPAKRRSYFGILSGQESQDAERRSPQSDVIERAERITLQHEITHQLLHALCPDLAERIPIWLAEGLACVFEANGPDGDDRAPGVNPYRRDDLLAAIGPTDAPSDVDQVCQALRTTIETVHASADKETDTPEFYARAWALTWYLINQRPKAFRSYLQQAQQSPQSPSADNQVQLFHESFGAFDNALCQSMIEFIIPADFEPAHP